MFETVHTVADWYDGPRRGIADYNGQPHLFESEWKDGKDLESDSFLLMPVDQETFALAREDWAIWRRWETALHQGKTTPESHPALPEDRSRHEELERLLQHLLIDPGRSIKRQAEFRTRSDSNWSGYGWRPLEVRWTEP